MFSPLRDVRVDFGTDEVEQSGVRNRELQVEEDARLERVQVSGLGDPVPRWVRRTTVPPLARAEGLRRHRKSVLLQVRPL